MDSLNRRVVLILILNIILGVALVIGINQSIAIVNFVSSITINSISGFAETFQAHFINFMKMDIKIIGGIFFCAFVVIYDVVLVAKWFSSFKFTSKKSCNSCAQRLIREQRQAADHVISVIVPVKRFRCVGCGQEYLKLEKHAHQHEVAANHQVESVNIRS